MGKLILTALAIFTLAACDYQAQGVQSQAQSQTQSQPKIQIESIRKIGNNVRGTINIGGTRIGF